MCAGVRVVWEGQSESEVADSIVGACYGVVMDLYQCQRRAIGRVEGVRTEAEHMGFPGTCLC